MIPGQLNWDPKKYGMADDYLTRTGYGAGPGKSTWESLAQQKNQALTQQGMEQAGADALGGAAQASSMLAQRSGLSSGDMARNLRGFGYQGLMNRQRAGFEGAQRGLDISGKAEEQRMGVLNYWSNLANQERLRRLGMDQTNAELQANMRLAEQMKPEEDPYHGFFGIDLW